MKNFQKLNLRLGYGPRRIKAFNFDNSHNSFLWPEYFIDYFCENGFHVRLWNPSCVYFSALRQSTAVQKNAYTSEITFLALISTLVLWNFKNVVTVKQLICFRVTAQKDLSTYTQLVTMNESDWFVLRSVCYTFGLCI